MQEVWNGVVDMKYMSSEKGRYYDLIRIPHGHIPAPKIKFWKWLPIPIKGERSYDTFSCPICGRGSFFKIYDQCRVCEWEIDDYETWRSIEERYRKRLRREKGRKRWKNLECALLPILILIGKAWYMRSDRYHFSDSYNDMRYEDYKRRQM